MGSKNSAPQSAPAPTGNNEVLLIASRMGPSIPGFGQAYHTSVEVNGIEYSFSDGGVMTSTNRASHQVQQNDPQSRHGTEVVTIGFTNKTGTMMQDSVVKYFSAGTYDLLRKNCNCFSDCAIWYLCKIRLHQDYRSLEKKGQKYPSIAKYFTQESNPKAASYDHEATILSLDPNRVFKESKGRSLRGESGESRSSKTLTREELRAKRLAALGN